LESKLFTTSIHFSISKNIHHLFLFLFNLLQTMEEMYSRVVYIMGWMFFFHILHGIFNYLIQPFFHHFNCYIGNQTTQKNVFLHFVVVINDSQFSSMFHFMSLDLVNFLPKIKPCFLYFCSLKFEDNWWVDNFKMSKCTLFKIIEWLKLFLETKRDVLKFPSCWNKKFVVLCTSVPMVWIF